MTTEDAPVLPQYYLVHATPAGTRYAYPVASPRTEIYGTEPAAWSAYTAADMPVDTRYTPPRAAGYGEPKVPGWLVTAEPAVRAVAAWTEANPERGPWRRVAALHTTDPIIVAAWEAKPAEAEPTPDELAHLASDHDEDDCLTCAVVGRVYGRATLPRVPREHVVDLTGMRPLVAPLDDQPGRVWTCTDQSLLAVYGGHTAHMWPGYLIGFRQAVVDALRAHPWVQREPSRGLMGSGPVYLWDREGKVDVTISIPWDLARTRPKRKGERGRGPFYDRIAMTHRASAVVPDRLTAPSKAEALARWDQTVAGWVARFLPDLDAPPRACSSCSGRGFHLAEAGR